MRSRSNRFTYCVCDVANVNVDMYVSVCLRVRTCVYVSLCTRCGLYASSFSSVSPYIILMCVCVDLMYN